VNFFRSDRRPAFFREDDNPRPEISLDNINFKSKMPMTEDLLYSNKSMVHKDSQKGGKLPPESVHTRSHSVKAHRWTAQKEKLYKRTKSNAKKRLKTNRFTDLSLQPFIQKFI
jgi:hypothetical protein